MTSFNSKELLTLHGALHEFIHYGFFDVFSTSKISSYQLKDVLDIMGIKYTSDIGSVNGYKYIRIKLK
ncbi:hypothetical protein EYUKI_264 [Bacillus phage Eyuki]|uniref:Uncharacterized protein n=1 Tax=Bacillus phage Eyuki TaxID=1690431 RepID=A0A0K2FKX0_9CAUD|nr:hypothetical protein QLX47_gp264 [Bacillus phage Eyuki]ALA46672.1 hypothetical protein EYUKI_264 [Bacillus phage Eyuki]ULF49170.1 hypothetical protein [Bacillus phage Darren]ULF49468.1 hypothetical protein [Bacillus phage MrBubbles]